MIVERYIPADEAVSLVEDVPGYSRNSNRAVTHFATASATATTSDAHQKGGLESTSSFLSSALEDGPVCWKCRGEARLFQRHHKQKRNHRPDRTESHVRVHGHGDAGCNCASAQTKTKSSSKGSLPSAIQTGTSDTQQQQQHLPLVVYPSTPTTTGSTPTNDPSCCPVCHGSGRLPPRHISLNDHPGKITRGRQRRRCRMDEELVHPDSSARNTETVVDSASVSTGLDRQQHQPQQQLIEPYPSFSGPMPAGYRVPIYGLRVQRATELLQDEIVTPDVSECTTSPNDCEASNPSIGSPSRNLLKSSTCASSDRATVPIWWPRAGEELCGLTSDWRILQRVGSHRWTTDDLVTASIACRHLQQSSLLLRGVAASASPGALEKTSPFAWDKTGNRDCRPFRYCDLGTGNASVLQMVIWKALSLHPVAPIHAIGIEARSEAVRLARRSLAFNLGLMDGIADSNKFDEEGLRMRYLTPPDVSIVHADFRVFCANQTNRDASNHSTLFDLVTGTPPYFRVDFSIKSNIDNNNVRLVETAVIRQGGMPTSKQSAPARCEFRGGFEAYCQAARSILVPDTGRFVVCENAANHARALVAFEMTDLVLLHTTRVYGKEGRPEPLFFVYVLKLPAHLQDTSNNDSKRNVAESDSVNRSTEADLFVRDIQGEWTRDYLAQVMDFMSV